MRGRKTRGILKTSVEPRLCPDTTLVSVNINKRKNQALILQSYGLLKYRDIKQVYYDSKR